VTGVWPQKEAMREEEGSPDSQIGDDSRHVMLADAVRNPRHLAVRTTPQAAAIMALMATIRSRFRRRQNAGAAAAMGGGTRRRPASCRT
jgi:hypothetical protein